MEVHELYISRALDLATLGMGNVSPNPLVGCLIVHEDKIVGEGYHQKYRQAHAEVNAIDSVADKKLLQNATLYVTLEPCNHFGKTPPCTELIIKHKIPKVVVCNIDPNPIVAGKGIERLRSAGVEVVTGVLSSAGNELNKRFFTFHQKARPYIILKWAQTADGFIARENFDSRWISNKFSRQLVHKWRSEEDAVLVGFNTALHDNPHLNVRDWAGRDPIRIVIDKNNSLPKTHHLFDEKQNTLVFSNSLLDARDRMSDANNSKVRVNHSIFELLNAHNILSVIVEGGANTLNYFIQAGLWDEARVFTSDQTFGSGIKAPVLSKKRSLRENVMGDDLDWYLNK